LQQGWGTDHSRSDYLKILSVFKRLGALMASNPSKGPMMNIRQISIGLTFALCFPAQGGASSLTWQALEPDKQRLFIEASQSHAHGIQSAEPISFDLFSAEKARIWAPALRTGHTSGSSSTAARPSDVRMTPSAWEHASITSMTKHHFAKREPFDAVFEVPAPSALPLMLAAFGAFGVFARLKRGS
jgi:hypothetical protein